PPHLPPSSVAQTSRLPGSDERSPGVGLALHLHPSAVGDVKPDARRVLLFAKGFPAATLLAQFIVRLIAVLKRSVDFAAPSCSIFAPTLMFTFGSNLKLLGNACA